MGMMIDAKLGEQIKLCGELSMRYAAEFSLSDHVIIAALPHWIAFYKDLPECEYTSGDVNERWIKNRLETPDEYTLGDTNERRIRNMMETAERFLSHEQGMLYPDGGDMEGLEEGEDWRRDGVVRAC